MRNSNKIIFLIKQTVNMWKTNIEVFLALILAMMTLRDFVEKHGKVENINFYRFLSKMKKYRICNASI